MRFAASGTVIAVESIVPDIDLCSAVCYPNRENKWELCEVSRYPRRQAGEHKISQPV
jgi:hypothetical protein